MSASRNSRRAVQIAVITIAALATASTARAQSDNKVAAEALFQEAHKLLEAGHYAEACEKLASSERLDPAVGTLVNLAHCYEKVGRTATAWGTYREAMAAARQAGQPDRERAARHAADALEPTLARLTIDVTPQPDDAKPDIQRDGVPILPDLWGAALPVDPGDHTLSATAPGRNPWSSTIPVEPRASKTVTVPVLEAAALIAAPQLAAPPASSSTATVAPAPREIPVGGAGATWNTQRTLAVVAAGIGLAGGAVALVEFLDYRSDKSQADSLCPGACSSVDHHSQAVSLLDDSRSAGNMAIVGVAIGGAALVGAVALWLTAGPKTPASPTGVLVMPLVTPASAGLHVTGEW